MLRSRLAFARCCRQFQLFFFLSFSFHYICSHQFRMLRRVLSPVVSCRVVCFLSISISHSLACVIIQLLLRTICTHWKIKLTMLMPCHWLLLLDWNVFCPFFSACECVCVFVDLANQWKWQPGATRKQANNNNFSRAWLHWGACNVCQRQFKLTSVWFLIRRRLDFGHGTPRFWPVCNGSDTRGETWKK